MALYSLMDISDELERMMQRVLSGEELTEEEYQLIDELVSDKSKKREGYVKFIKTLKAEIDMVRNEEKALANKRKSISNTMDRLRKNLLFDMNRTNEKQFRTGIATVSVVDQDPKINVVDAKLVHEQRPDLVDVIEHVEYIPDTDRLTLMLNSTGEVLEGTKVEHNRQYIKIM